MPKPTLAYWNIRGYAQHIRLLLRYLGADFEDKTYNYTDAAPDYGRNSWFDVKYELGLPFANIPYWVDEDVTLTESKAIFRYVAKKYGKGTELVIPEGVVEEAKVDMVMGALHDMQQMLVRFAYGRTTSSDVPIEHSQAKPLEQLANYLGDKKWIFGDKISYVDFYLYEVLKQYTKFRPKFLQAQPRLEDFLRRFEAIPELQEYLKSIEDVRCYSPFAIPF